MEQDEKEFEANGGRSASMRIRVPSRTVVHRKEMLMKEIQEETGASLNFLTDHLPSGKERDREVSTLHILGEMDQVLNAHQKVEQLKRTYFDSLLDLPLSENPSKRKERVFE